MARCLYAMFVVKSACPVEVKSKSTNAVAAYIASRYLVGSIAIKDPDVTIGRFKNAPQDIRL